MELSAARRVPACARGEPHVRRDGGGDERYDHECARGAAAGHRTQTAYGPGDQERYDWKAVPCGVRIGDHQDRRHVDAAIEAGETRTSRATHEDEGHER